MLPGPDVQILDAAPPASTLTDTGTRFIAGLSERGATSGDVAPGEVVHSLGEFTERYGARQSYNGPEYDTVEAFFAEGGSRLFFSRIAGPAAVIAQAAVPATGSKFTAKAKGPGAYYNDVTVAVASGVITVKKGATTVEVSPALADIAAAQAWATDVSEWINITPLASGALADSAAVTLAGGADDRTNITDTERTAALARFGRDLGPGQVSMPGDTRSQAHAMLASHALAMNRFALADAPDTATVATIVAAAAAIKALGVDKARHIQLLDPWHVAPAISGSGTRTVPPSAVHGGLAARVDAMGNPNRAVAGRRVVSRFATGLKYRRSDAEREQLANAGVTVYVDDQGVQPYDDVVPVDAATDPEWLGAAGNRFVMRVIADALDIAKNHMFGSVAGPVDLAAFQGDLKGMLAGWYADGALYGATAADAFRVETGAAVNTPETLAARQLRAAIALKIAPNARQVIVQITNTPLTGTL